MCDLLRKTEAGGPSSYQPFRPVPGLCRHAVAQAIGSVLGAVPPAWSADAPEPVGQPGSGSGPAGLPERAGIGPASGTPALAPMAVAAPARPPSQARRRLWQLGAHAGCPVIGVCLPLDAARALARRVLMLDASDDDYTIHNQLVGHCRPRGPVAEALQDALDARYAAEVQTARAIKTRVALREAWQAALHGDGVAGALWSTLTHPACDSSLEDEVLRDVHLLQHQWGASERADRRALRQLRETHAELQQQLLDQQSRARLQAAEQTRRIEQQQAELVRLRAELIQRDTRLAHLQQDLEDVRAGLPDLPARQRLQQQVHAMQQRMQGMALALRQVRASLHRTESAAAGAAGSAGLLPVDGELAPSTAGVRAGGRAAQASPPLPSDPVPADDTICAPAAAPRAVLCVGGLSGAVPVYRDVVEHAGSRFLHHDGGLEHHASLLEASLAAADLVICQTGCISHDAYWRVKAHCKRTGTPCVFVDKPSRSSLERALAGWQPLRFSRQPA
ncbi:DUF2325 domain-containing protein [Pseudaquabacterium rugosum]|uniref:DUF2325 domain-containing protein n=1 Tax=Pseudaquabacterium rugosum TaxID=2984194 RepID=A0ABU9BFT7_9BURK